MKLMRAVLVLAGLGLVGALALGSGAALAQPAAPAEDRLVADRQARGADDRPRREGVPEDVQGGADAGRAGQGRQAARRSTSACPSRRSSSSSSRCTRSASTAATGAAPSPVRPTTRTATASSRPTRSSRSTTPAPRSSRASRATGRSATTARRRRSTCARALKWSDGKPLHGRRLHVLVQRHLPQQEHRPHAVLRVPDQRQGREDAQGRRLHRRLRISRALCLLRLSARRAARAIGGGLATRGAFQNWGGAYAPAHYLKQFLPKYSSEDAVNKKAKDAGLRQLGVAAAQPVQLGAQPRAAGDDAVEDRVADQHADLVDGAQPVLLGASTPRATSFPTSTGSR